MIEILYQDLLKKLQDKDLVFFGTGKVGQNLYKKYCVERNILSKPLYWCDNNKSRQGQLLQGIEIISLEDTYRHIKNAQRAKQKDLAIIIASTGTNLLQMLCQIEQMGLTANIYSGPQIDAFYYFRENSEKIEMIIDMLKDEKSKYIYKKIIDNMKYGNCVDFSIVEENQYFDNDVIQQLDNDEVLVDAGVCNGEEIDKALRMNKNIKIYAFEPDHNSMTKLKAKYKKAEEVCLLEYALWNQKMYINFSNDVKHPSASRLEQTKTKSAHREENENIIEAVALDEIINEKVTFIKMDIEGAEYNALQGAEKIIKKYRPKLAICVYHSIEDYIRIPFLIKSINPDYEFYFRHHSATSGESVLYAI